ncbi:hypothetical protein ACFFHT_10335 [Gallibacterium melopsittaci]|uniref:Uncharacterized protein n=1 Tax=Gallibacterium melopsittaci TaxID=516063 RepID=A0ABV6HYJ5_9PAST
MKEQFISEIKNKQYPAKETLSKLDSLKENNTFFEPFDGNRIGEFLPAHRWDNQYFTEKAEYLNLNFSYELCLHLLEIKQFLQDQNADYRFKITPNKETVMNTEKNIEKSFQEPDLTGFKPVSYLVEALTNNNISEIRSALMIVLNDRDLSIQEMLCSIYYVWHKNQAVFEESKQNAFIDPINHDESVWNKDYFFQQQTFLNRNFTLERILHLLNVRESLIKSGHPDFQPKNKSTETKTENHTQVKFSTNRASTNKEHLYQPDQHNDFIKKALAVGGAVLAAIAVLFFIVK